MLSIGVDPGKAGAIAVIVDDTADGPYENVTPVPIIAGKKPIVDLPSMDFWLRSVLLARRPMDGRYVAAIEKVGAMPKQGVTSMFSFGETYGQMQALLKLTRIPGTEMRIPLHFVRPATWKKEILRDTAKDKQAAILWAMNTFPDVPLFRTMRCKTMHDGMAEALAIAQYARGLLT